MIDQAMVDLIGSYGFPIMVTIYLLWERRSVTKDLISAVRELTILVKELEAIIKSVKRR